MMTTEGYEGNNISQQTGVALRAAGTGGRISTDWESNMEENRNEEKSRYVQENLLSLRVF